MKYFFLFFLNTFFLISCNGGIPKPEDDKDLYLKKHIPKIYNLNKEDLAIFKESMIFENNHLSEWNDALLEKAFENKDDYNYTTFYLYKNLNINVDTIVTVGRDSKEVMITTNFYTKDGNSYPLDSVSKWNSVFYMVTLNCGSCINEFVKMNELSNKFKNTDVKFVALVKNLDNLKYYTKGQIFKDYGFLNDNWIILEENFLTPFIHSEYDSFSGYPEVFFRKNGNYLTRIEDFQNHQKIEEIILSNFRKLPE